LTSKTARAIINFVLKGVTVLDLTKVGLTVKGGWVALSEDKKKLVAHAKTLVEVIEKARKASVDRPVVFKLGPFGNTYAGSCQ